MSIGVGLIPMVLVPLTFLFVLLIILIVKSPRAGAWAIGGLVLAAALLFWRLATTRGMPSHGEAIPLFIVPMTFLFVLLVILLAKSPKTGAGLIVAVVVMVLLGLFLVPAVSHRRAVLENSLPPTAQRPWTEPDVEQRVATIQVWEDVNRQYVHAPSAAAEVLGSPSTPASPSSPPAPIWSDGVEQEFESDVYPSSLAAARALGRRMADPIRTVSGDPNAAAKIILFQENNERSLIATFGRSLEQELLNVRCFIEADLRNIVSGEVGLTLRTNEMKQPEHHGEGGVDVYADFRSPVPTNTQLVATAFAEDRRSSAEARFIDKPWVEGFGAYASARPSESLIIARSNGTCTSESEANQQALDDARARLTEALGRHEGYPLAEMAQPAISTTDVLNGGFVVDRFVQSFDGSAGKIWRQALLIDVSGPKLAQLARVKMHQGRQVRESWARMGFSLIGVLVLIGAIYFFLNMATRGYYEWSLRIAGVVLAIVAIVSVLMIVQ